MSPRRSLRPERGSGPVLSPAEARKAWRGLAETAASMARNPAFDPTVGLIAPLRAAPKGSYPLPAGDIRAAWAEEWRGQVERYRLANLEVRTLFAPVVAAGAQAVERLTFALGAEVAQASLARTGFREDD